MGHFKQIALLVSAAFMIADAAPYDGSACVNRVEHKPWGMLSAAEQQSYIKAELCLMNTPAKSGIKGAKTRWDELQWNHILNAHAVHDVGHFLPWHRYNLVVHQKFLREDCSYKGPLPYWDETADSSLPNVAAASIFKADAFGGDGSAPDNRITNGPFANVTLHMQGLKQPTPNYRITRNFNSTTLSMATPAALNACFQIPIYTAAWECLAGTSHSAGHGGTGGLLNDVQASPGDPVFYLHHGWLDAMWWKWQSLDLPNRLTDMGGRNIPRPSYVERLGLPFPGPEFTEGNGDPGQVTTLSHVLYSSGIAPNVTVGQVMDVRDGLVCADYIFSDSLVLPRKDDAKTVIKAAVVF